MDVLIALLMVLGALSLLATAARKAEARPRQVFAALLGVGIAGGLTAVAGSLILVGAFVRSAASSAGGNLSEGAGLGAAFGGMLWTIPLVVVVAPVGAILAHAGQPPDWRAVLSGELGGVIGCALGGIGALALGTPWVVPPLYAVGVVAWYFGSWGRRRGEVDAPPQTD